MVHHVNPAQGCHVNPLGEPSRCHVTLVSYDMLGCHGTPPLPCDGDLVLMVNAFKDADTIHVSIEPMG